MKAKQPSSSLELGLNVEGRICRDTGPEAFIAKRLSESPTGEIRLMESILERENMLRALRRVRKNKGAPGIDGMTVDELPRYLKRHWKLPKTKLRNLRKAGLPDDLARPLAATRKGTWHISANSYLARALPTRYFTGILGLVLLG